ncbi:hypothetical protein CR513_58026, partial [Mucuna pruriens]
MTSTLKKTKSKTLSTLSLSLTGEKDKKETHTYDTIADKRALYFHFQGPSTFGAIAKEHQWGLLQSCSGNKHPSYLYHDHFLHGNPTLFHALHLSLFHYHYNRHKSNHHCSPFHHPSPKSVTYYLPSPPHSLHHPGLPYLNPNLKTVLELKEAENCVQVRGRTLWNSVAMKLELVRRSF